MKKNNVKAFTLVEMLIVIVIIGILIASLMPRMQSAQGRARDVARKNDLAQIQTAIITSQQDRGEYPGMSSWGADSMTWDKLAEAWISISAIKNTLLNAWMSSIPADPNKANVVRGLWNATIEAGNYGYMVTKRNWIADWGFVLMAKTEVEWSSNWVVCLTGGNLPINGLTGWLIASWTDLATITTCSRITKSSSGNCSSNAEECYYADTNQLAYILMY